MGMNIPAPSSAYPVFPALFTCDPGRFQPDTMQNRGMNTDRNRSSSKSVIIRKFIVPRSGCIAELH
ncbi:MAG: hypothetical protein DRI57_15020 [Deltaproteobacteria bacterium]|nr:MAG: hypothetical protein DRI57_15020 [Deltaproteobacteria bacterium]